MDSLPNLPDDISNLGKDALDFLSNPIDNIWNLISDNSGKEQNSSLLETKYTWKLNNWDIYTISQNPHPNPLNPVDKSTDFINLSEKTWQKSMPELQQILNQLEQKNEGRFPQKKENINTNSKTSNRRTTS